MGLGSDSAAPSPGALNMIFFLGGGGLKITNNTKICGDQQSMLFHVQSQPTQLYRLRMHAPRMCQFLNTVPLSSRKGHQ